MIPAKGTPMLKLDFSTQHSMFRIRSLRTRSFEIYANLYNYCGPIVINGRNKRRLTNDGSLIKLLMSIVRIYGLKQEAG